MCVALFSNIQQHSNKQDFKNTQEQWCGMVPTLSSQPNMMKMFSTSCMRIFAIILLYHAYDATAAASANDADSTTSSSVVEELESCNSIVNSFPKDNTDIDGNVFRLNLSTVECKCAGKLVRCVYTAEGTSKDSGAINYTSDKCAAYDCSDTAAVGEGKVCQTQEGWKQNDSFDVSKFNEELFMSWCVVPEPPSDATMLRTALFGIGVGAAFVI